ncbi:MAG: rod shape-determining protein MreC, partial [Candidatus Cloacimonetes bacterium]|nr:rod shape-determining protein MreC [Candidatus Cloacimonadota bacterium]
QKLIYLDNQFHTIKSDSVRIATHFIDPEKEFICHSARVINNSTNKLLNYITINRGSENGIRPEMCVINSDGVVGIVTTVSNHFGVVMPILNPNTLISCKIKSRISHQDTVGVVKDIGSLLWDGKDYRFAKMVQVPRHVNIKKGDSIVTSGYSDFFPEGIMVGVIEDYEKANDDNYYEIKVRLSVNFRTVSYVNVMDYLHKEEQEKLENRIVE